MHLPLDERRTLAAWLAVLMLLAALAPSVSRLLPYRDVASLEMHCLEISRRQADVHAHGSSSPVSAHDHGEACPFCLPHAGSTGFLPTVAPVLAVMCLARHEQPCLFFLAPRPLFAWAPALARGPPSSM